MRQIGEQWVEKIDGVNHMVKAVAMDKGSCNGCIHNSGFICKEVMIGCNYIIKDLGILNDEGLLPCPFCGDYPKLVKNDSWYWYSCDSCECEIKAYGTVQQAIEAWNRRA